MTPEQLERFLEALGKIDPKRTAAARKRSAEILSALCSGQPTAGQLLLLPLRRRLLLLQQPFILQSLRFSFSRRRSLRIFTPYFCLHRLHLLLPLCHPLHSRHRARIYVFHRQRPGRKIQPHLRQTTHDRRLRRSSLLPAPLRRHQSKPSTHRNNALPKSLLHDADTSHCIGCIASPRRLWFECHSCVNQAKLFPRLRFALCPPFAAMFQ